VGGPHPEVGEDLSDDFGLFAEGDETASGEDLLLTEADIANLIRTKAAIYAACTLILQNVGLSWATSRGSTSPGGSGAPWTSPMPC